MIPNEGVEGKAMFSRQQISDMALELPGACDDTPFASDPSIIVFRHGSSGKWFGILLKAPGRAVGLAIDEPVDVLNLKCDPLVAYGMMASHPDIVPAYHMNKQHWISLRLGGDVPEDVARMLMRMSFDLTHRKPRRRG